MSTDGPTLRQRLGAHGLDATTVLVLPSVVLMVALFVYPFFYGVWLSFHPKAGAWLANYARFFSEPYYYKTVWTTLKLALPVTVLGLVLAIPVAFRVRLMRDNRWLTTLLVLPITLGTVLVAQGMMFYFGPLGWFNRVLMALGVLSHPIEILHGYAGVFISLMISGFPFAFLLVLSYVTGIDPSLEKAAATLGAGSAARFREIFWPLLIPGIAITFCLSFTQAYAVLPSAILVGDPANATRVISIAAYQEAFESYDYAFASAIAMIMGAVQLAIMAAVLSVRSLFYRGPVSGGKG